MNRPSLDAAGLVLVGFVAVLVGLHDGLSLHAPVIRVLTRAGPVWIALGALVVIAAGLLWARRRRRRASAGASEGETADRPGDGTRRLPHNPVVPVALALGALAAILTGVFADALHARPVYNYTIQTGWDGPLNYQEREMLELAAIGVLGTIAAVRWRRAAYAALVAGVLVAYFPVTFLAAWLPTAYTGLPVAAGAGGEVYLGAEPYLLLVGSFLLAFAGLVGALEDARSADRGGLSAGSTPTG